jgi:hypothetical protein
MTWSREQCLAWDFTCPYTLAVSHLNKAVNGLGQLANDGEQRKRYKYAALSTENRFVQIATETLGPAGNAAKIVFSRTGPPDTGSYKETAHYVVSMAGVKRHCAEGQCSAHLGTEHLSDEDAVCGF